MKIKFEDTASLLLDLEAIHGNEIAKEEFAIVCMDNILSEIFLTYYKTKTSSEYDAEKQRRADKLVEIRKQIGDV